MNEQIKAIRAEIKRLQKTHEGNLNKPMERGRIGYAHGVVACCDKILSFIDSIEKQPEAEICPRCKYYNKKDGYCYEPHGGLQSMINENGVYDCTGFIDSLPEETDNEKPNRPTNLDSLEAARDAANEVYCYTTQTMDDLVGLFLLGVEWQKGQDDKGLTEKIAAAYQIGLANKEEQMMKEAVEGTVMDFSSNRPRPQVDVLLDPHKYHTGDKVRIIIVKEDKR